MTAPRQPSEPPRITEAPTVNVANMEALAAALRDALKGDSWGDEGGEMLWLALLLAKRGVLMPSAMSDDQATMAGFACLDDWGNKIVPQELRAALTRIARGETP